MTEESFNKLVNILREDVTVDGMQSLRSSAVNRHIYPEMIVASGLIDRLNIVFEERERERESNYT